MDDNQFLQAVLPAAKGGLGVSSARLLALPAFLASAVGAKNASREIFEMWMEPLMMRVNGGLKLEMAQEKEIQKNWAEPIFDRKIADLTLRLESMDVKRFNAFQDRFGSQWLNVIPCKNLFLKMSNQQLRIAIGLQLGLKRCERPKCVCSKDCMPVLSLSFFVILFCPVALPTFLSRTIVTWRQLILKIIYQFLEINRETLFWEF